MQTELDVNDLITVDVAIERIDAVPLSVRTEAVPLTQAAGRFLAEAVMADRDYPPFDKALMDGYAVRAGDVVAGTRLHVIGEIAAGADWRQPIQPGQCVAIMTGAPMPPAADAVVPVEWTAAAGESVSIDRPVAVGHAIARQGLESAAGQIALPAGTRLGSAQLAVCAQVGAAVVKVFARPRVGVLTSGDEVVPYDQPPSSTQIRNSNAILLTALLTELGCEPIDLGHAADDPSALRERLSQPGLDALLITGGMSMGRHDHTPAVLREMGYDLRITKLKIRPGKPFVMAVAPLNAGGASPLIFGLPGNPVSAYVCTLRLASRALLRMQGASPEPQWLPATLGEALPPNGPREFYMPIVVERGTLRMLNAKGSADVFTLARAAGMIRRPASAPAIAAGQVIEWMRMP